jgi:hypothetical protein
LPQTGLFVALVSDDFFIATCASNGHWRARIGVQRKYSKPVKLRTNLLALVSLLLPFPCVAQASSDPLNRAEILGRLASGSSRSYVAHLVKTRGINFSPTDYYLSLVERAGGTGILLNTLQTARTGGASTSGGDPPFENLAQCAEFLQLAPVYEI